MKSEARTSLARDAQARKTPEGLQLHQRVLDRSVLAADALLVAENQRTPFHQQLTAFLKTQRC